MKLFQPRLALMLLAGFTAGCGTAVSSSRSVPEKDEAAAEVHTTPPETPPGMTSTSPPELVSTNSIALDIRDQRAEDLLQILTRSGTSAETWEESHAELLGLGEAAVKVLLKALKSGSDIERELAATALVLIGPDAVAAADGLEAALKDRSPFVRANAASALLQFPDRASVAIPALIHFLDDEDPQLRELAAMNLSSAEIDASPYVEALRKSLTRENSSEVTTAIVALLGRTGTAAKPAVPTLQKIVFEQPGTVGSAAENAIQQILGTSETPLSAP